MNDGNSRLSLNVGWNHVRGLSKRSASLLRE